MRLRLPRKPIRELRASFRWPEPRLFNMGWDSVDPWARRTPGRLAILEPSGRSLDYRGLKRLSDRLGSALEAIGVGHGDRVGLLFPQSLEAALAHLAVYKLGAIALPLSPLFGEEAVRYRLEHAEAKLLLGEGELLEAVKGGIPEGVKVLDARALRDLMERAQPLSPRGRRTSSRDPALLIYTSGTTGKPKGVLLPHATLLGHLPGFQLFANFPRYPALFWSPADWAWMGGLMDVLIPALYHGFTVLAYRPRRFDPEEALWVMRRYGVTHSFLFPTALKLLRNLGSISDPPRLKSIHSGGEPLGEELQAWARANLGLPINEFYGQTEANLLVGNCYLTDPIKPGSMGLPYPGHEVAVLREDGSPCPPGEVGEVALKTPDPVAFLEYWRNPEATQAKFLGPYLLTGDLAVRDEEGYFWFKGRKDDLIKSAGYRISPFEVEEALLGHPAVAMVGVVGLPHPERGEEVAAFVKLKPGLVPSVELEAQLQELVRRKVGHHAYPRRFFFVEELPLTTTGKLQRFQLKQIAKEEQGRGKG